MSTPWLVWHVYMYMWSVHDHMKVLDIAKCSDRRALHFQSEVVPGKFFEHFATVVNVRVWCGLCCMLVKQKMRKVNLTP